MSTAEINLSLSTVSRASWGCGFVQVNIGQSFSWEFTYPNKPRIANQNIDLPITNKACKSGVYLAFTRDIRRSHKYLDSRVLLLDRGFGLEEGLLSTAEKSDA
jgi:hypothetical protein